jgi:hypothetical protein
MNHNRFVLNRAVWVSLSVATVWMLLTFLRMWWQPILADEWDFYRAMTNWWQDRALIPHPQAYVHLGQLCQAVFGQTISAARLAGVLCAVVSVWLIPPLIRWLWPGHPQQSPIIVIAIVLTALAPLTLQNAMLLDIDNTLLTPMLMLLLGLWVALQDHPPCARVTMLTVTLTAVLWVKLPTPPLLMGALGLYHLLRREWSRAIEIVLISILGLALFGATFAIYSQLTGYQFAYFAPMFGHMGGLLDLSGIIVRFPQGMGIFVLWLSLPLTILIGAALGASVQRFVRRQTTPADALSLYVLIVALFYPVIYVPAWGYPRYQAPIVPIIGMLAAALLASHVAQLPSLTLKWLAAMAFVVFLFLLVAFPDPLRPIYRITFESGLSDLYRRLQVGIPIAATLGLLPVIVLAVGPALARLRRVDGRAVQISLLGVLTVSSLAALSITQIGATYSTRYHYAYDYADHLWSVQQVQANGPGSYILATKDILYESRLAGEEIYPYLCATCSSTLIEKIQSRRIDALAWTTREDTRSSAVTANVQVVKTLNECYTKMTRGDLIVYQLKPNSPCAH